MIDRLRSLAAAATPGPWAVDDPPDSWRLGNSLWWSRRVRMSDGSSVAEMRYIGAGDADAALIAASRNALPALLDVAEAARRLLVGSGEDDDPPPDEEWDPIYLNLRAALDRLEARNDLPGQACTRCTAVMPARPSAP